MSLKRDLVKLRKSINGCPVLSDDEKSLLIKIDVQGESVTNVAKSLGKAKSTVSEKHSKALKKFKEYTKKLTDQDFDKLVFGELNSGHTPNQIIAKYGHAEEVLRLSEMWKKMEQDDYWKAIKLLRHFGAINDSEKHTEEALLRGVERLIRMWNQAIIDKDDVEDKLKQYEKSLGTFKELAARIVVLKDEYSKLPNPVVRAISQFDDIEKIVETYTEKWRKKAVKAMIKCDLFRLQFDELRKNLEFYREKHGRNIKVGDIITSPLFPGVLYFVVGESEDKQSWVLRLFARSKLQGFLKTYKYAGYVRRDVLEHELSKKVAIDRYEIVDID